MTSAGGATASGGSAGAVSYATGGSTTSGSTGGSTTSGSTGGTTAQGSGGAPGRDPSLFRWPEASADGGAALLCKAGHYVGTYNCNVSGPGIEAGTYPLSGPVDLRLAQAQSGEFLSVSGGTLTSAAGFLGMSATVTGTLNCQTGAFSGTLTNGTLTFLILPAGTFAGDLSASFVSSGPKLDGSWTLVGQGTTAGYSCAGPWTATWQGP